MDGRTAMRSVWFCLFTALMLLFRVSCAFAFWPEGSNGIAAFSAQGISIDGARFGDADYGFSTQNLRLLLPGTDGSLAGRIVYQSTGLDDKGSTFSACTFMVEGIAGTEERKVIPWIAAGVSYVSMDADTLGREADDILGLVQFGVGFSVRILPDIMADVRYRYLRLFESMLWLDEKPVVPSTGRHNVLVGIRAEF